MRANALRNVFDINGVKQIAIDLINTGESVLAFKVAQLLRPIHLPHQLSLGYPNDAQDIVYKLRETPNPNLGADEAYKKRCIANTLQDQVINWRYPKPLSSDYGVPEGWLR